VPQHDTLFNLPNTYGENANHYPTLKP